MTIETSAQHIPSHPVGTAGRRELVAALEVGRMRRRAAGDTLTLN